ncbi:MAG: hydroxylamine oxidase [Candidatus Marinimicrobia bacterium]|nr:hydroxylamine oxidase [Candidatus Neomarinimicrobiota bacterium]
MTLNTFGISIFMLSGLCAMGPLSDETEECISCHETETPGIVQDWLSSRHAKTTVLDALEKERVERRVSTENIVEKYMEYVVGCYECHSQNINVHTDNFEHFDYNINIVVSPKDCATCHETEVDEYSHSKKAHAIDILIKNPVYSALVTESLTPHHGKNIEGETCYGCHGTEVSVRGMKTIHTKDGDEIEVPDLANWPNQGVGRINPDGSKGSCTSCHPRHSFSIEVARKPYTCSECHLEPDVPAYNVYKESKHGNMYMSLGSKWNWNEVPWVIGEDFKTPTCATCHNSLVADTEGEIIATRTHDFGSRLWTRLFGLIYSHPQPKDGQTWNLRNKDGLPMPTTFTGELAETGLIDETEQVARKSKMSGVCLSCHSTSWVDGHFRQMEEQNQAADAMVLKATQHLQKAWNSGVANAENPFDEYIERLWIEQWLFYANSARYASAMSGPDYATFKNGWWEMTKTIATMEDWLKMHTPK